MKFVTVLSQLLTEELNSTFRMRFSSGPLALFEPSTNSVLLRLC